MRGLPGIFAPPGLGICLWQVAGQPGQLDGALALALFAAALALALRFAVIFTGHPMAAALVPAHYRRAHRTHRERPTRRHPHGRGRKALPAHLRRRCYAGDRYRCVACGRHAAELAPLGRGFGLQVDHLVPYAAGGLASLWNTVTLCGRCNRIKSNYNVSADGYVHYRNKFEDLAHVEHSELIDAAAWILEQELAARRSPLRWARCALAA
jgi:5-methylcytosine-specific restriction endonuclease McrA